MTPGNCSSLTDYPIPLDSLVGAVIVSIACHFLNVNLHFSIYSHGSLNLN